MKVATIVIVALALSGTCVGVEAKDEGLEYQMPSAEFVKKFGVEPQAVPYAPEARFAPIPPYPFKMREQGLNGWSAYVLKIDAKSNIRGVDLVGFSRKEFGNGRDSLAKWRFGATTKEGLYLVLLRYKLTPSGATIDQVLPPHS